MASGQEHTEAEESGRKVSIALTIPEHPLGRVIGYGVLDAGGDWPGTSGRAIQRPMSLAAAKEWKRQLEENAKEDGKKPPQLQLVEIRELPESETTAPGT